MAEVERGEKVFKKKSVNPGILLADGIPCLCAEWN